MKKLCLLFAASAVFMSSYAQQYKWGKLFDGLGVFIRDMAIDANGNKYLIGSINYSNPGNVDLDPGPGTHLLDAAQGPSFCAKYDMNGNFIWGQQLESEAYKIAITNTNNIMLARDAWGDMDPGPGIFEFDVYGYDIALVTYSGVNGSFIEAKQFQTIESGNYSGIMKMGSANSLDIDNQGNIYLCGTFSGYVDLDLNGNFSAVYNIGPSAAYFLKYNSNYGLIGGRVIPGAEATGLRYNPNLQYTYVTGNENVGDFTSGDIFLTKIDNVGNAVWYDTFTVNNGGAPTMLGKPYSLSLDNSGNIYLHGQLPMSPGGEIDFNPGPGSMVIPGPGSILNYGTNSFLSKYNSNGGLIWAKKVAPDGRGMIWNMEIDDEDKLICNMGVWHVSGGAGSLNIATNTVDTAGRFLAFYDTAANLLQYKKIMDNSYVAHEIMKIQGRDIYISGYMYDSIDFDPATPLGNFYEPSTIGNAGFLVKYNQCPDNNSGTSASFCTGGTYQFGSQTLNAPGIYTTSFNIGNSCDSVVILNLSAITVDVAVNANNNTLSANAVGAAYQWVNCSNNTPVQGATAQTFIPAVSGSYKAIITQNGCSDTSACYAVDITGINQPAFAKGISIYPNPANNELNISYNVSLPFQQVIIADITGRTLQTSYVTDRSGHLNIKVQQLQAGVYFIKLIANKEQAIFKFIKQ